MSTHLMFKNFINNNRYWLWDTFNTFIRQNAVKNNNNYCQVRNLNRESNRNCFTKKYRSFLEHI